MRNIRVLAQSQAGFAFCAKGHWLIASVAPGPSASAGTVTTARLGLPSTAANIRTTAAQVIAKVRRRLAFTTCLSLPHSSFHFAAWALSFHGRRHHAGAAAPGDTKVLILRAISTDDVHAYLVWQEENAHA